MVGIRRALTETNQKWKVRCGVKDDITIESLKEIALFSSLTSDELHQVREKIVFKRFKKNEIILHEENTNEYMYMILKGEAKVVNTTDKGKEILITMHQSGDFFGELSLIDGKTAPATVIATKDSVTTIISKKDFYSLLFSQSQVLENLLQLLCSRIRESLKKIQILNFNNAAQRIKMLFLMLSETYGEKTEKGTILKIRLIHQDIADMIGLTRETVTRILDKWQRGGEIEILQNRFILLRPEFETITF
ncbi:MAG TPA: Crp/Fnr family transcriptional regulator [Nitrospirota bacterium]|nr:Crp/Fnr family transcriptional regulator [Nitrospirota bacterium]